MKKERKKDPGSGGQNKIDIKGQRFGKLVAIENTRTNNRGLAVWKCKCDCGILYETTGYNLRQGRKKSCGCQHMKMTGDKNPRWSGFGEISGSYWHRIKQGAKARNLELTISIEDAWNLFLKQKRKCVLTGRMLVLCKSDKQQRMDLKLQTASLDRIDSEKGYIVDNIQWVHKDINKIKMQFNNEEFINLCKEVINYHESRTSL